MAEKPSKGLADVVAASTALSDIDGLAGRLFYRGYDIDELAGTATFEETAYLLQRASPASHGELAGYRGEIAAGRTLGKLVTTSLPEIARSQQPMEALRSLVSLASADDPDVDSNEPGPNTRKAARLTAQQPVLVAAYQAARRGRESPPADPEASVAANFLLQISGTPPSDREAQILDTCLVLHADHTMNASTFAARVCTATQVRARLRRGEKIMGFGHRVYKTGDPRAAHLRAMSAELGAASGDDTYYRMSQKMAEVVFAEKGLFPNVDFYAATVYHYLRIPTDLFTSVFSVSRMAGWTSHVMEQHADNRLIRPDSEYIGDRGLTWTPLDQR